MLYVLKADKVYINTVRWPNGSTMAILQSSLKDEGQHFTTKEAAEKQAKEIVETGKFSQVEIVEDKYDCLQNIIDKYGDINPETFDLIAFSHYIEKSLGNEYDVITMSMEDMTQYDIAVETAKIVAGKNPDDIKLAYAGVYNTEDLLVIATKKEA